MTGNHVIRHDDSLKAIEEVTLTIKGHRDPKIRHNAVYSESNFMTWTGRLLDLDDVVGEGAVFDVYVL
jgi:hypothetical protein